MHITACDAEKVPIVSENLHCIWIQCNEISWTPREKVTHVPLLRSLTHPFKGQSRTPLKVTHAPLYYLHQTNVALLQSIYQVLMIRAQRPSASWCRCWPPEPTKSGNWKSAIQKKTKACCLLSLSPTAVRRLTRVLRRRPWWHSPSSGSWNLMKTKVLGDTHWPRWRPMNIYNQTLLLVSKLLNMSLSGAYRTIFIFEKNKI